MFRFLLIVLLYFPVSKVSAQEEPQLGLKSLVEYELLPIKKMLTQSGPFLVDSFINMIGDRHQFVGINILGRGWYFNEYAASIREIYTGSHQKIGTILLETRIHSRDRAMVVWGGDLKLTLRDSSVVEYKMMIRNYSLRRINGEWKITFIHESVGAPFGSWPPFRSREQALDIRR